MLTRREVLVGSVVAAGAASSFLSASSAGAQATSASKAAPAATPAAAPAASGPFTLPKLPYAYDALEPHIDAQTMTIHHDKHHAAYIAKLNAAVEGKPELAGKTVEQLVSNLSAVPESVRSAVKNQGGGHANHSLFWKIMAPGAPSKPSGELKAAIDKTFGSYDKFAEQLATSATGVFGSGWAWLSVDKDKALALTVTANQDNPWMEGKTPLLGIDVWEHAYYLKYQNRRPDYIAAWLKVINWDFVSAEYKKALAA
jgi:superoxide dismutase, Fe-Mn family